ncbi:hypothetical protein Chor_001419, partial [Crotalus horridus]
PLTMHHIIQTVYSWFWWENIWMPANCTWADLEDHNGYVFPKPRMLFATIPYAFVMLVIRFFVESWRCLFYSTSFIAGTIFLCDKSWFYDLWQVWLNYPNHPMLPSQYWYYMLQMSFYWSLLFTLGTDTKRKDFMAHVVHHFATLGLMFCSFSANYLRLGTLAMIVHDSADIWLEVNPRTGLCLCSAAKLFNYARWDNTCSALFVIFAIVFFITRLILFPCWILRASIYYPVFYTQTLVLAYFVYNGQLLILQGLHLYWGYLVFKILKKFIFVKNVKDERSDEEEDSLSDTEGECMKKGMKNGLNDPLLNNNNIN